MDNRRTEHLRQPGRAEGMKSAFIIRITHRVLCFAYGACAGQLFSNEVKLVFLNRRVGKSSVFLH